MVIATPSSHVNVDPKGLVLLLTSSDDVEVAELDV